MTIFTIPKPFVGHIGTIQRNAIGSWMRLGERIDVVLYGDEKGTAEVAREFGTTHYPNIPTNSYGTPLVSAAFGKVRRDSRSSVLCFVNSDIVLMSDLLDAVGRATMPDYLIMGSRWDLEFDEPIDFSVSGWDHTLRALARSEGNRHPPQGSDYFIFPRCGAVGHMPDFAVGRPGWDNWVIYSARMRGVPVIDASSVITAIHQNHDYAHVASRIGDSYDGPEAKAHYALLREMNHYYTLRDATHVMTKHFVLPAWTPHHVKPRRAAFKDRRRARLEIH